MTDLLAYAVYLIWLAAGCLDFACHRRTCLALTSGVRESALHLLQLGLIGAGVLLWLALEITSAIVLVLTALVAAHAVAGYLDTRQAYSRRDIRPVEQHLHSVLDIAPIAALGWVAWTASDGAAQRDSEWGGIMMRSPPMPWWLWVAVLAPAIVLCVVPACLEYRQARAAALADATLSKNG